MKSQTEKARDLSKVRFFMGDPIPVFGKRVVDVGCGEGNVIWQAERAGARSCVGVDVDLGLLRDTWGMNFQDLWHRLGWKEKLCSEVVRIGQDGRLPIKDSSADIVICSFVFPYARDKLRLFGEVLRILAPGGCAYFLNTESLTFYTSVTGAWSNAFFLVDERRRGMFKHLKGIVEKSELTNGLWQKETDSYASAFGMMLDTGIMIPAAEGDESVFMLRDVEVKVVNFYAIFRRLMKKCGKVGFRRSGFGMIMEKSGSFGEKDGLKALERMDRARKYFMLNINLAKQDKQRPLPAVQTVLDSRIMD